MNVFISQLVLLRVDYYARISCRTLRMSQMAVNVLSLMHPRMMVVVEGDVKVLIRLAVWVNHWLQVKALWIEYKV